MSEKTTLIKMFLDSSDSFVSGEMIARKLGISRAAVWKHIGALKHEGYTFESLPNKGYKLVSAPIVLSESALRAGLMTKRLGRRIFFLQSINSTNSFLKEKAEAGENHGAIAIAINQTDGKGRIGRAWHCANDSIALSVLLRLPIPPPDSPKLTIVCAVAVTQVIREICEINAQIKWPNDILAGDKKLCGISLLMSAEQDVLHYVIAGMGINVNTNDFPEEIQEIATSTLIETGKHFDLNTLVCELLLKLEKLIDLWQSEGFDAILEQYKSMSATLGQQVRIIGTETIDGLAKGLDADGHLLLEKEGGLVTRIVTGDVSLRRKL